MDKPRYTVNFNFDNPNTELVFNQPNGVVQFPKRLYGETAFELLLAATKGPINDPVTYDFTNFTSAELFVKITV